MNADAPPNNGIPDGEFSGEIGDFVIRDAAPPDAFAIIDLWEKCALIRPWNDPQKDIDRKFAAGNGAFWLVLDDARLVASVMVGYDGHRGSVNYLAVDPDYRGRQLGRLIMERTEKYLIGLGCPKISLCVRKDNDSVSAFYDSMGYAIDDVHYFGKRLIPDD